MYTYRFGESVVIVIWFAPQNDILFIPIDVPQIIHNMLCYCCCQHRIWNDNIFSNKSLWS